MALSYGKRQTHSCFGAEHQSCDLDTNQASHIPYTNGCILHLCSACPHRPSISFFQSLVAVLLRRSCGAQRAGVLVGPSANMRCYACAVASWGASTTSAARRWWRRAAGGCTRAATATTRRRTISWTSRPSSPWPACTAAPATPSLARIVPHPPPPRSGAPCGVYEIMWQP